MKMKNDIEGVYRVLDAIEKDGEITQRGLAEKLGYSLGKTNYLLKGLLEKGFIKADNFRKNDNKLGYIYMLTPEGIMEKMKVTVAFLKRREKEYELLHQEIEELRKIVKN